MRFAVFAGLLSLALPAVAQQSVDFNFDVKPILSDRCFLCHGPDEENREADLRLDTRDAVLRPSESGELERIVAPGQPAASELIRRILSDDPDVQMPPPDSNLSLSDQEKDILRRWVRQGAEWKEHWSFIPLAARVPVPPVPDGWAQNEIDHFVARRLRQQGLEPAARASRERLIRRVSFDLTGLPPSPEEIDAFLADQQPGAFERVVDRLLASDAYGERMASEWLDVARYSDTYGYQVDRDRFVWPWRDWVVRAYNQNLPFDEFVTQQLAGDLLPDATQDQILATTFCRLHPQKVEGGSVPEEFRVEYVADRTQTLATGVLGLTMECSRCHDHKYDPILQREYYQLFAFFNNIDEAGLYSYFTNAVPTPTLRLTDAVTREKLKSLQAQMLAAERTAARKNQSLERLEQVRQWFDSWRETSAAELVPGEIAHLTFEDYTGPNQRVPGVQGQAVRLTGDDGIDLKVGNFRRWQPFSVSLWMNTPDRKPRAVVFHRSRAWTDAASRGYQLLIEDGCLSASLIHFWPGNALRVRTKEEIPPGQWVHVTMTWDGSSRASGLRLYVNGQQADVDVVRDHLYKNITGGGGDNIRIGERFRDRGFTHGLVDEFRVFDRQLSAIEASQLAGGHALEELRKQRFDELGAARQQQLVEYFNLSHADAAVLKARGAYCQAQDALTEIMVMREMPQPRQTHRLKRGAYDAPAEVVPMETPAVFPAFPGDAPRNRLGLAKWLFAPTHPLTARVAVNRYWQLVFGYGLVRTPEDFGSQGELPTHPELMDWLARDFMDHGWDVKRLMRTMVLSATYQQDSVASPELLKSDPENRLLARGPSYRLSAEMLRDSVLAASGLLVRRLGGPPAKPYDAEVSFKPTKRDTGEGLYRRSLYTYWKRTAPSPVMMTLDASKRDVCRMRRERTASPLEAFVLLNGPQFVEAARALAESVLQTHQEQTDAALVDCFRRLTGRRPSEPELRVLRELFDRQVQVFSAAPEAAATYLQQGDHKAAEGLDKIRLAALSVVANALFGLDDVVMQR